jgi:hypothetical protein
MRFLPLALLFPSLVVAQTLPAPTPVESQAIGTPETSDEGVTAATSQAETLPATTEDELVIDASEEPAAPLTDSGESVIQATEETTPPEADTQQVMRRVTLQALNKVTSKTSEITAPIGVAVRFGTLDIVARQCWQAPPEERPENSVLLDISELKNDEKPTRIFAGWMFSSSPSLSALEHPIYDITVVDCAG